VLDRFEHVGTDASPESVPVSPTWPPGLAIERRLVEDDEAFFAFIQHLDHLPPLISAVTTPSAGLGLVAEELGRADFVADREPDFVFTGVPGAGPALPRLGPLLGHRIFEAAQIDMDVAQAQRVLRQVEREAVGVVELEGGDAVEHVALAEAGRGLVEELQAARQGLAEPLLLETDGLLDHIFAADQLRIGLPISLTRVGTILWITGSSVPSRSRGAWRAA
jgi:hypothetical protein